MKTSLIFLATLAAMLIISCKKTETPKAYQVRVIARDSCTKPILDGGYIRETVFPWIDFTNKTEDEAKAWAATNTKPYALFGPSYHDTVYYEQKTGYYRLKP